MAIHDEVARRIFGITRDEAVARGICIKCKSRAHLPNEIDQREFRLSAFCPECFRDLFPEEEPGRDYE